MEAQVKILQFLPTRKFNTKNGERTSYEFIGQTLEQYPKKMKFEVFGDERFQKMGIEANGVYQLSFDIESTEWNDHWFTSLKVWRVTRLDGTSVSQPQAAPTSTPAPATQATTQTPSSNAGGDLPF